MAREGRMSATAARESAPNRTEAHQTQRILAELRGELIARGMALQANGPTSTGGNGMRCWRAT
jgi:hypothetical protein